MSSTGEKLNADLAGPTGRARRAFTLVELVVVLLILGVVLTMVVPQLSGAVSSSAIKEQTIALLVAARHARDYAVSHRCCCRLSTNVEDGTYALLGPDEKDESEFVPLGLGWQRPVRLEKGVSFGTIRIDPTDGRQDEDGFVCFRPNGQADAAVVELTNGKTIWSLTIMPHSGRASVIEGSVSQTPYDRQDLDARH